VADTQKVLAGYERPLRLAETRIKERSERRDNMELCRDSAHLKYADSIRGANALAYIQILTTLQSGGRGENHQEIRRLTAKQSGGGAEIPRQFVPEAKGFGDRVGEENSRHSARQRQMRRSTQHPTTISLILTVIKLNR